jgi:hypothetical protein
MHLTFRCPACQQPHRTSIDGSTAAIRCEVCNWSRAVDSPSTNSEGHPPPQCLVCGCGDLWRQKNFPPRVGMAFVAAGTILSTIAWSYYRPLIAIGILMAFALVDLLLFAFMGDVLACYKCGARHGLTNPDDDLPRFDLETAERYRQERLRLAQSADPKTS